MPDTSLRFIESRYLESSKPCKNRKLGGKCAEVDIPTLLGAIVRAKEQPPRSASAKACAVIYPPLVSLALRLPGALPAVPSAGTPPSFRASRHRKVRTHRDSTKAVSWLGQKNQTVPRGSQCERPRFSSNNPPSTSQGAGGWDATPHTSPFHHAREGYAPPLTFSHRVCALSCPGQLPQSLFDRETRTNKERLWRRQPAQAALDPPSTQPESCPLWRTAFLQPRLPETRLPAP